MSELTPPFSRDEFIAGVYNLVLPENERKVREKPRASSLLDCTRQQAYTMMNTPRSNPEEEDPTRAHQALTNEMNRHVEDVSVEVIAHLDRGVTDRQISLPANYPVTGHPDGRLAEDNSTGLWNDHDKSLSDGLVWGFEHKVLGRYAYLDVFKNGLFKSKPGYIAQALLYGDALGWDAVLFVILAADASSMRAEHTNASRTKQPWTQRADWHPKVQLVPVDLRPLYPLIPGLHDRARSLSDALQRDSDASRIKREYSGTANFPCGYCDWKDRCNLDGEGDVVIPVSPLGGA